MTGTNTTPSLRERISERTSAVCRTCLREFVPSRPWQRCCTPEHKAEWDRLVRQYGVNAAEGMFEHYRQHVRANEYTDDD